MALFLLFFVILWAFLVIGFWKLVRFLVYRTGRRPAVFVRPWLRRTVITLLFLIPFSGAIIDSLTFELACQLWGREIINEPRQADGFEGSIGRTVFWIADETFDYIDMPRNETEAARFFLATEGDEACSRFFAETKWQSHELPNVPSGGCLAIKHVPLGSARYVVLTDALRKPFKDNWFGHRLYKYEAVIYDRKEADVVGLYRQLMAFRDSFFFRYFSDDAGRHICGERLVKRDGVLRTLAPHSGKGGAV